MALVFFPVQTGRCAELFLCRQMSTLVKIVSSAERRSEAVSAGGGAVHGLHDALCAGAILPRNHGMMGFNPA